MVDIPVNKGVTNDSIKSNLCIIKICLNYLCKNYRAQKKIYPKSRIIEKPNFQVWHMGTLMNIEENSVKL